MVYGQQNYQVQEYSDYFYYLSLGAILLYISFSVWLLGFWIFAVIGMIKYQKTFWNVYYGLLIAAFCLNIGGGVEIFLYFGFWYTGYIVYFSIMFAFNIILQLIQMHWAKHISIRMAYYEVYVKKLQDLQRLVNQNLSGRPQPFQEPQVGIT